MTSSWAQLRSTLFGMIWMSHQFLKLNRVQCLCNRSIFLLMEHRSSTETSIMLMVHWCIAQLTKPFLKEIIIKIGPSYWHVASLLAVRNTAPTGPAIIQQLYLSFKEVFIRFCRQDSQECSLVELISLATKEMQVNLCTFSSTSLACSTPSSELIARSITPIGSHGCRLKQCRLWFERLFSTDTILFTTCTQLSNRLQHLASQLWDRCSWSSLKRLRCLIQLRSSCGVTTFLFRLSLALLAHLPMKFGKFRPSFLRLSLGTI